MLGVQTQRSTKSAQSGLGPPTALRGASAQRWGRVGHLASQRVAMWTDVRVSGPGGLGVVPEAGGEWPTLLGTAFAGFSNSIKEACARLSQLRRETEVQMTLPCFPESEVKGWLGRHPPCLWGPLVSLRSGSPLY